MKCTALQVKTGYSILESMNNIKKLINKAVELEYTSLAITDNNNMFGVMEFYLECKKNNIKPIIGMELLVEDKKILLYAINNNGYKNLIKLSTIVSDRLLSIEDLKAYSKDLLLIIPSIYFNKHIFDIYEHKFVGYTDIKEKEKIKETKVFINNVSYIEKEDFQYLDYLYMIRDNKTLGEFELNTYKNQYLLTRNDLFNICDKEDIDNMEFIENICNVELSYTEGLLPIYDTKIDSYKYLSELCYKGLDKRLGGIKDLKYHKRLEYELGVIKKMGFCDYFLVVWDYVKFAKFNNILVGPGRGSAAGSLVSYTLGITDIDPIKYNLLFERFLNPERITMPDIDIDFDANKRQEVIDYVIDRYGEKRVAGIITFNTLAAKQVIRDIARVMKIKIVTVDELTKLIDRYTLMEAYNNVLRFKTLIDESPELTKLFKICLKLEGLPRHVSMHAAGIIMSRKDIDEIIPLYKNQLGMYVTGYSMNYLENLGLLKMDFLGLSNLTLISNLIEEIRKVEKLNITFTKIPLEDKKTLKIFHDVKTDGIFQFESPGMRKFLSKLKVTSFDDIVAALALFRPGPMDNIDTYINRKNGNEKINYLHKDLEPILKSTYGIIIYQEQIMQIAVLLAGYSYGEADLLRRAMSKKKEEILINEKPKFISRCIKNGYKEDIASKVYELILKFANYGFNKSHSVAYAIIAYKMAFLKTYFFKYFMTSLLTNSIGNEYKTKQYIMEVRQNEEKMLLPNINLSIGEYIVSKQGIICPLNIIKNIGTNICNEIILERKKGLFIDIFDFSKRLYSTSINKKVMSSLIEAGCFDNLNYNRKSLINNLDNIINYAELSKDLGLIEVEKPEIEITPEYSKEELSLLELKNFGFYLSEHPISKYKKDDSINSITIQNNFNKNISIILYIDKIKEVITKKNDVMAFVTGSDEYSKVSLTMFPDIYIQYNDIKENQIIEFHGRVEKRFDKYQIVVNNLKIIK